MINTVKKGRREMRRSLLLLLLVQLAAFGSSIPALGTTTTVHSPWNIFQANGGLCCAEDDQLALDPLGDVWFTEQGDGNGTLGFMSENYSQGTVTLYRFAQPDGIAIGPDHHIWFSDASGVVGVLTTLGPNAQVVTYPTPGYTPVRIVAGRFYLWVALTSTANGSAIGRMSTTGNLTVYPLPIRTDSHINSLTIGPNGRVWFADFNGYVGKFDPATKQITEYPTSGFSYLVNITSGADGNMYVTGGGTGIGVVSPTGSFQMIQTDLGAVADIARGPDGHIWITGQDASQSHWVLARKEGSAFVDHTYPQSNCDVGGIPMGGLIAGIHGDIWFLAEGACVMGRSEFDVGWIGDYIRN